MKLSRGIAAALAAGALLLVGPAGLALADEAGGSDTPSTGGDDVDTTDTHPSDPDVRALTDVAPMATLQQSSTNRMRTELRELHTVTMNRFGNMASADIEAMVFVVMIEDAKQARQDLKAQLEAVRNRNRGGPIDPCPGCDP